MITDIFKNNYFLIYICYVYCFLFLKKILKLYFTLLHNFYPYQINTVKRLVCYLILLIYFKLDKKYFKIIYNINSRIYD